LIVDSEKADSIEVFMSEERLERIENQISVLQQDITSLKQDVSTLKQDMSPMNQSIDAIRNDIHSLIQRIDSSEKTILTAMREGFNSLRHYSDDLNYEVADNARATRLLKRRVARLERKEED
jgi:chromosome segregation ATPase